MEELLRTHTRHSLPFAKPAQPGVAVLLSSESCRRRCASSAPGGLDRNRRRLRSIRRSRPAVLRPVVLAGGCVSVRVRKVGLSRVLLIVQLVLVFNFAQASLNRSNSEVVTTYSSRAGRMEAISSCAFCTRSGVGGCVEKILGMLPGWRRSSASIFSKKLTKALGSYPALYMYCRPR